MQLLPNKPALALTLLAVLPVAGDSIRFHPAAESVLVKRFATECEVVLEDLVIAMNGEESDPSLLGIPADLTLSCGYSIECADRYEGVADGRPTVLVRSFQAFEGWFVDPGGQEQRQGGGRLEDRSIRFTWNEEEERYDREVVDESDVDEDELAFLNEDLDLRGLLPDDDVEEGERWEIEGAPLMAVLLPGVDLAAALAAGDTGELPAGVFAAVEYLAENATATCTFEGVEELFGRRLGRIAFECTLEGDLALDPSVLGIDAAGAAADDANLELSFGIDLIGVCLWDMEAGRFHSLELDGEGEIAFDATVSLSELGLDIEASAELSVDLLREAIAKPR